MTDAISLEPIERSSDPTPSLGFDFEEHGHIRYFEEDYWRLSDWSCSATGMITTELSFLEKVINERQVSSVYDAGCGRGRHLIPMLNAGIDARGLDISASNVAAAKNALQHHGHDTSRATLGDVAAHRLAKPVDLVLSMLSSFGYADDDGNSRSLLAMRANLRHGGLLVLDLPNREQMVANFLARTWAEVGGYHYLMHYDFDFETGYRDSWLRVISPDLTIRSYFHRVRIYTTAELKRMLANAGFRLLDVLGDFTRSVTNFDLESRRLQYVAAAV
jgi:SAM-dependent methyltransferase